MRKSPRTECSAPNENTQGNLGISGTLDTETELEEAICKEGKPEGMSADDSKRDSKPVGVHQWVQVNAFLLISTLLPKTVCPKILSQQIHNTSKSGVMKFQVSVSPAETENSFSSQNI
ncbi:hypothetical protein DUI87_07061 [Hirundo rustica rustica]|uniref:Uncharacterized protein n=1 Tax=Hirundo rustica rustica TaxID=333673 RepID=A0A3M0KU10_HIRRU|nr:hypothetical protein DUI87_07061 [Hirundo rustica rustica]